MWGVIDRRRFLVALAATGGVAAVSVVLYDQLREESSEEQPPAFRSATAWRSDKTSAASWTEYFGAVQDQPGWASAQRGGIFADGSGEADVAALRDVLARTALLSWPPPQPSQRTAEGVAEFMTLVRATEGSWWRDRVFRYTSGLIEAQRRSRHKVIGIHLGNEIDAEDYRQNIASWATAAGLEYPHPATSFGDDGTYRRDHLGYYVEYFLAPAADGVLAANERAGRRRVPIVLGSIVGARQPFVRNELLPSLLDYRIEGTYAPALAGRQVKELIDYLSVHYVLTPEAVFGFDDEAEQTQTDAWRLLLDDFHDRWVETGVVRGVWHTEEGGAAAQRAHQHASLAVRVFARTMSWAAGRGASADAVKVFAWYKTPADAETGHHLREDTELGIRTRRDRRVHRGVDDTDRPLGGRRRRLERGRGAIRLRNGRQPEACRRRHAGRR